MKNYHLIFCSIILIPIAIGYGLSPNLPESILSNLYDFKIKTTDQKHIFRAIMGLYLAMTIPWTMGVFKPEYWKAATLSVVLFMGGLALGRLLSVAIDGTPSIAFLLGTIAELLLALWGVFNLKKYT